MYVTLTARQLQQNLTSKALKRNRKTSKADLAHIKRRKETPIHRSSPPFASGDSQVLSWLRTISPTHSEDGLQEVAHPDEMGSKRGLNTASTIAPSDASGKSSKSSVDAREPTFRNSARLRSIFIFCEPPPGQLIQRAKTILCNGRGSPELEDTTASRLVRVAERMEAEPEEVIGQELAIQLIPAIQSVPDSRLDRALNRLWTDAIPIPITSALRPSCCLPLSKPKPDCSIGFAQSALTVDQLSVISHLIDQTKRSYATPDRSVLFPFLSIEYKAASKGGTHYVATNQAANTGAIALQGHLELMQRISSLDKFDFNEPRFFSITLDAMIVQINVHWVRKAKAAEHFEFHVAKVDMYCIQRDNEVKALQRAVKNILDHAVTKQLPILSNALVNLRNRMLDEQEAETSKEQDALADENYIGDITEEVERVRKRPRQRLATGNLPNRQPEKRAEKHDTLETRDQTEGSKNTKAQSSASQSWKQYFLGFLMSNS